MKRLNIDDFSWIEGKSPKGKFHRFRKDLSAQLGSARAPLPDSGRHLFEIELVKLPAGAINWPYHSHSVEHEVYVIVSGTGRVRTPEGELEVRAGDIIHHPPGEPHQMSNPGPDDLLYYVIANNVIAGSAVADECYYPDSDKWATSSIDRCFRPAKVDYYDGEE
jgi:mannose-6-phosphate isomerase-like protein (cupin superfamily)